MYFNKYFRASKLNSEMDRHVARVIKNRKLIQIFSRNSRPHDT
jgi:hypothetical protein